MKILGIDPGATTGWCLYDSVARCVLDAGQFRGHAFDVPARVVARATAIVVERPVAHGATRPQVVDCAYTAGRIVGWLVGGWYPTAGRIGGWLVGGWYPDAVHELTRREVCRVLTDACHLDTRDRVKNDATAWAALVLLHGEGSDKKPRRRKGEVVDAGGAIGRVTSHERAALAVAVAWSIQAAAT